MGNKVQKKIASVLRECSAADAQNKAEVTVSARVKCSFFNLFVLMILSVACMIGGVVLMTACKNPAQGPSTDAANIGQTVEVGDFKYYITSITEVRVDGFASEKFSTHINIPSTVDIDSVTYYVTEINESAFAHHSTVTTITIGERITNFGRSAFRSCTNVTTLNWNAVNYPTSFESSVLHPFHNLGTWGSGVQLNLGNSVQYIPSNFLYVSDYVEYRPNMIGTLTIPNSVTYIGANAFSQCVGFTTLNLGTSVNIIDDSAFYGCTGFTGTLIIPNRMISIGASAFIYCSGFTGTVDIPETVTSIGYAAFCETRITVLHLHRFAYPITSIGEIYGNTSLPTTLTRIIVPIGYGDAYKSASGWSTVAHMIAEDNITDGVLRYEDRGTYWEVTSLLFPSDIGTVVDIPAAFTWKGKTMNVTSIAANAFEYEEHIGSVTIGPNITNIGEAAFRHSIVFNDIVIPNSVTTIGNYAFDYCSHLEKLTIGTSVTSIGLGAFRNCYMLKELTWNVINYPSFPSAGDSNAPFYNTGNGAQLYFGSTVQRIPDYFLYSSGSFERELFSGTLTIPSNVKSIGNYAFSNAFETSFMSFTSLNLETGVQTIGDYAFYWNLGFTGTLTIPNSVKTIGNSAFYRCNRFTSLSIGTGVQTISDSVFAYCEGFTGTLRIPDNVTSIGSFAFGYCGYYGGFNAIDLGNGLKTIGNSAFSSCSTITGNLNIPNSVTTIGAGAFYGCSGINGTITIGTSVTSIGDNAFINCTNVTGLTWNATNYTTAFTSTAANHPFYNFGTNGAGVTVSFGSTVTTIPNYFLYVDSATFKPKIIGNLNISDTVTTIGISAFQGLTGLTGAITIGTAVTSVGNSAFAGCTSVTGLTWNATNYTAAFPSDGNHPFSSLGKNGDGVQLIFGDTVQRTPDYFLRRYLIDDLVNVKGTLTLPNSVNYIGKDAFTNCTGFGGDLIIPNSVIIIKENAFQNCVGFEMLDLGTGIQSIGDCAFYLCTGFTGTLTIPDSVTFIDYCAFLDCSGFTSLVIGTGIQRIYDCVFWGCSGLTTLRIPNNVTEIGAEAFRYCYGLTSIEFGTGLTLIENLVFENCSNLTGAVVIPASVRHIGYGAFIGTSVTILCLQSFTFPSTITILETMDYGSGKGPYLPTTLQYIVVPNGSGDVYRAAEGWSHESAVDKIVEVTQVITWSNTFGQTNPNASVYDIDTTNKLQPLPNRTGWNFKQWRLNNSSGAVISSIDEYTYFAPITLYAEWEATATVVSFATGTAPSDGGSITGTIANRNRYADQSFTLPTQKYTVANNNWEHIGWTTTQYGKQLQNWETLDSADFALGATIPADDIYWGTTRTYYAVWKRLTNTLAFKPGTLTDDSGNVTITGTQFTEIKTPSVNIDLPTTYFTVTGYTQIGWTKDEITGGAIVGRPLHNGYTLATDPQITNTDETYYPVWKPDEYTVQYRPGKYSYGLTSIPSATKYHGASITITSTQYVNPNGYVQVGWTTTTNGGLYSDVTITHALNSTYSGNAALTLYPVWQSGTGVVILHFTGGPNGETLDIETVWVFDYTNPTTLTLPSYVTMNSLGRSLTFEGWYTSPDFNPTTRISDPATYAAAAPADRTEDYSIPWTLGDNTVIRIYAKWS